MGGSIWKWCRKVAVVATALLTMPAFGAGAAEPQPYTEPHRPQFHFSPERNWMNDPNGLVFHDGEWHLFYQYNPEGDTWGHMSWGHAVSPDLLHWKHLPVALREEDGVMIFSGSAVVDHKNTSGFGTDGRPPLVAIYTGHGKGEQTQNIAHSTDRGRTWTKFAGNPVIDENLKDFRDPKVIWHEPTGRWVMVVALPDKHQVRFYGSKDLKKWERLGEFGGEGAVNGIWECPDLFELPVEKADGTPTGRNRWVLVVNINGGTPAGGSGCQYFVGQFDGATFKNDNPKDVKLWADYGADFYAAQSWSDVPATDGRRIWIGWMSNWRYANQEPTKPWRTAMTVPRELKLRDTAAGVRLLQQPVRELATLRGNRVRADEAADVHEPRRIAAIPAARALDIEAVLTVRDAAESWVRLSTPEDALLIGYDARARQLFVDRTLATGQGFHKDFPGRHAAPLEPGADGTIKLRILLDHSSVEVFADDGAAVITDRLFLSPAGQHFYLHARDGRTKISMDVWEMKSIWNSD